jgi:hypothetical protein
MYGGLVPLDDAVAVKHGSVPRAPITFSTT